MVTKGRLLGILFAAFALACLVATYDYSRGRTPVTQSPLVVQLLTETTARECGRDATAIVERHIPLGTAQAEAERILATVEIEPPRPWFWHPEIENATRWTGETLEAMRTIKATAFGNQVLRVFLSFENGRVRRLAAEVICRFE